MPVRKLHLCFAMLASVGAGQAAADDASGNTTAAPPYTVWTATLNVNNAEPTSPGSDFVRAVIVPSRIARAKKTLDLKTLSLSDFGDVDPAR